MVSSKYFRRQAGICLRLATSLSDRRAAATLIAMADDFIIKAGEIEGAEQSHRSRRQDRTLPDNHGTLGEQTTTVHVPNV